MIKLVGGILHVYFTSANCVLPDKTSQPPVAFGERRSFLSCVFSCSAFVSMKFKPENFNTDVENLPRGRPSWHATRPDKLDGLSDRQARRGLRGWVGRGPAGVSNDRKLCFDSRSAVRREKQPRIDALPMA